MSKTTTILGLVFWLGICLLVGYLGSLFTAHSVAGWYPTLNKPFWTPPNTVFGPVWTTLYIMMGIAAWLVWSKAGFSGAAISLTLFLVQLMLNLGWSVIFFGLQRPDLAFAEILFLFCLLLATTISFWRALPAAGFLLVPYLVWIVFACLLNFAIWRLNS